MVLWSLDGQAFIDHGGSGMGRKNGEGSGSTPGVLKLEEEKKRTLVGVGGKVEEEEEEEEEGEGQFQFQFQSQSQSQSFLLHHIHSLQQQQPSTPPKKQKTATTANGGHFEAVPGGRIVRSTGCKDRHSKVCTARGLRDRRVRLSAHTAIGFYDVQDRLGYDRPSMAVDWLLRNAKAAIDELPAWQPSAADDHAATGGFQQVLTEGPAAANSMNSFSSDGVAAVDSFRMASASCYPPPDLLSRTSSQDLRLSLDSINPNLFSFDTGEQTAAGGGGGGGYSFSLPAPLQQSMIGHRHLILTQRGPLQSSSSTPVPSWMDQTAPATSSQSMHPPALQYPSSSSSSFPADIDQFGPNGVFSGFRMSSWIQGEEHGVDGVSEGPPPSRR